MAKKRVLPAPAAVVAASAAGLAAASTPGGRRNPIMSAIAERLTPAQMPAVASSVQGLR
jgi:hypothetical protein